jgi:hypothetical protein
VRAGHQLRAALPRKAHQGRRRKSDYLARQVAAYQRALDLYVQSNTQPKITEKHPRAHSVTGPMSTQHRLDELIPLPDAPEPEPVESPAHNRHLA